jgi:hypothetical protein
VGLAILAKLIALPWALLPLIAAKLFGQMSWRRIRELSVSVALAAGIWLIPSALYVIYQEVARVENKQEVVATVLFVPESQNRLAQIGDNLDAYAEAVPVMLSPALSILLIGLGVWQTIRQPRNGLYLLSFTLLVWVFIILISAQPSTRYLALGVPSLLILAAAGIDSLVRQTRMTMTNARYHALVGVAGLALLWGMMGLRFVLTAWNDPRALSLADRDIWEYFQNSATGYGLREAAADLPTLPPLEHSARDEIRVVGFVGACHILRLYLPADSHVHVACPYFRWSVDQAEATLAEWEQRVRADGVWYVLADDKQPMDLNRLPFRWQELKVYERPHAGVTVRLFRVEIADDR